MEKEIHNSPKGRQGYNQGRWLEGQSKDEVPPKGNNDYKHVKTTRPYFPFFRIPLES